MERRFAIFLVLTVVMWTGFIALQVYFAPKPPPAAAKAKQPAADPLAAKKEEQADKAKAHSEVGSPPAAEEAPKAEVAVAPAEPHQLLTLGSLDPASPFRMLVTLDSRGAAVERVELNSPRYKSVEDLSGYLGHLALTDAPGGGAEVHLVGPGTPAALAQTSGIKPGLIAGDIIQQIDNQPIADAGSLKAHLANKTRPDQEVIVHIQRPSTKQSIQFKVLLARRPLEVVAPESHSFKAKEVDPPSLLLSLDYVGGRPRTTKEDEIAGLPSLIEGNWKVEKQGADFVEFSFTLDDAALARINKTGGLKIVKRYTLAKADKAGDAAYHLDLQVAVHNLGSEVQSLGYSFDGPTGLPLEGWWYSTKLSPNWGGAGARDVVWQQPGFGHSLMGCPKIVSETKKLIEDEKPKWIELLAGDQATALDYAGVDTQFFASVVLPQPIAADQPIKFKSAAAVAVQDVNAIPKTSLRTADVTFRMTTSPAMIQPGDVLKHDYRVFFGPKDPVVLRQYGLGQLIEYGWKIFAYPAILLLWTLNGLYQLTAIVGIPNYGIAIILLTVIVRTCMIPISLKQARSAAKMQELAPEIQKIKDKFPDDPMKQHAAVQELYKKHDFNMFAGCLPVFIQLPIFIGLYRCLSVDIDLRDAALIPGIDWASNLAGPDKLFYWKDWVFSLIGHEADGWLGPFFNVFPLITVALFLVQQKMFTPPATDEQTRMQQQMMTYMTVFMGVMFYKVPAGLCIYFITSSLWGICERKLLPKPAPKSGSESATATLPAKPASPNGSTKQSASKRQKQRK